MISLRLSEAEYDALKAQYRSQGARSVSDLARLAIQQVIKSPGTKCECETKLNELDARLNILETRVSLLCHDPEKVPV